jgi:hypothetical protein
MTSVICFNSLYVYLFISLFSILLYSFVDQQMFKYNREKNEKTNVVQPETNVVQQQPVQQQRITVSGPTRIYPGGRLDTPSYDDYQLIGFLFNDTLRFPLYGRPRYPGRTDKYEYYLVDESRNKLKIPITTKNYNELLDGELINIPELTSVFTVKLYEFEKLRYDPRIF